MQTSWTSHCMVRLEAISVFNAIAIITACSHEVLSGDMDEDRRDNAQSELASDHQPRYGDCRPPRGLASCHNIVRRDSASQLHSQHLRFAFHAGGFDSSSLFLRP